MDVTCFDLVPTAMCVLVCVSYVSVEVLPVESPYKHAYHLEQAEDHPGQACLRISQTSQAASVPALGQQACKPAVSMHSDTEVQATHSQDRTAECRGLRTLMRSDHR